MFHNFLCSIIQPQQLRSGDTPKDVSLLCCSLSSRWKIAHRPKYKATESKYRASLQAYRQRWNTTQLLTTHTPTSLSAQTAQSYTDQRKLSLGIVKSEDPTEQLLKIPMSPKSATKYNLLYRGINFLATLQLVCPTKENFPWLIRDRPLKSEHTQRKTLSIQSWHSWTIQEPQPNGEQKPLG